MSSEPENGTWNLSIVNNPPWQEGPDVPATTAGYWTTETDHIVGTSLSNIDVTSNTHFTTTIAKINDTYTPISWGSAMSGTISLTSNTEIAPSSNRRSSGQLYPRHNK